MSINSNFTDGNLNNFTYSRSGDTQTFVDFEGVVKEVPADAPAVQGARFVENLVPDPESNDLWDVNGSTPPVLGGGGTYLGEVYTNTLTFDPTMTNTGFGGCRGTTNNAQGRFTTVVNRSYRYSLRVVMSRALESGEEVRFFVASTPDSSFVRLQDLTTEQQTTWTTICSDVHTASSTNTSSRFLLVLIQTINTAPVTVYVREAMAEDVTGQTNQNPSSFLSSYSFFTTENGNTVSSDVVTEATGSAISGIDGLLLEDARTNVLTESDDINNGWTHTDISVTNNALLNGEVSLALLSHDTASAGTNIQIDNGTADGGPVSWSFYVSENTTPGFNAEIFDITAGSNIADSQFNWSTGDVVIGTNAIGWYDILNLGNGFWKVSVGANTTTATNSLRLLFYPTTSVLNPTIGDSMYFNGGNLELAGFGSSLMRTDGATETRSASSLTRSVTVPANTFNAQIKFVVNFDYDDVKGGSDVDLIVFSDGTANNEFKVVLDATTDEIFLSKTVSGGTTVTLQTTANALQYATGDELTVDFASNRYGIHLKVNSLDWISESGGDATTDWSTLMDQVSVEPAFVSVSTLSLTNEAGGGSATTIIGSIIG